jgi:hypothetical protein
MPSLINSKDTHDLDRFVVLMALKVTGYRAAQKPHFMHQFDIDKMRDHLKKLMFGAFFLALNSCATIGSNVTRFHALPPRGDGQTFVVQPFHAVGNLEFATYAERVASHLQSYGWIQATSKAADYRVILSYQMGKSHERHGVVPLIGQTGGGTTYHSGSVNTYGNYGSSYGSFSGTSFTPATFGVVGSMPYNFTEYDRFLFLKIQEWGGSEVFDGRVTSTGSSMDLASVLPQMIDSLFTRFPGESGKTKYIEKSAP